MIDEHYTVKNVGIFTPMWVKWNNDWRVNLHMKGKFTIFEVLLLKIVVHIPQKGVQLSIFVWIYRFLGIYTCNKVKIVDIV